jgi:uncharacterized membrane protein YqjE
MSAEPAKDAPGLLVSLKRLGRIVLAIAHNRLELFLVEAEEERHRAIQALLLTVMLAVLGLMTLMMGTFTVVVIFWEEHRLATLAIICGVYLLATLGLSWKLRRLLYSRPAFSATLAELEKDRAWIEAKR